MVRVTTGRHLRTPLVYQSAYQSVRFPWDSGARWRPSATLMTRYSKQRVVDGMEEVRGSSPLSSTVGCIFGLLVEDHFGRAGVSPIRDGGSAGGRGEQDPAQTCPRSRRCWPVVTGSNKRRTSDSKEIAVTKAPLPAPVREADDREYATNLRRATLARPIAGFKPATQGRDLLPVDDALDHIRAVEDVRAGVLVSR